MLRLLVVTALVVLFPFVAFAQEPTIKDSFPNRRPDLRGPLSRISISITSKEKGTVRPLMGIMALAY